MYLCDMAFEIVTPQCWYVVLNHQRLWKKIKTDFSNIHWHRESHYGMLILINLVIENRLLLKELIKLGG